MKKYQFKIYHNGSCYLFTASGVKEAAIVFAYNKMRAGEVYDKVDKIEMFINERWEEVSGASEIKLVSL